MNFLSGSADAAALAWGLGLLALLGYAAAAWPLEVRSRWPAVALAVAWVAHGLVLLVDIGGLGLAHRGARFGFAPALSVTVWLVLAVHAVESRFVPLPGVRRLLAVAGSAVVLLTMLFPGDMWVQVASPWVPLHWLLGVASYGLFGAAVLHATLLDAAERQMRPKAGRPPMPASGARPAALGLPLMRLERLTFRFVDAGFVVLSAALLLGVGSALQTPSLWKWDHKTVFSLLGWGTVAVLMVGRHVRGWRGRHATRWLYAGAALLLLAYIGSRFVLEVLLGRMA
ncbi:cytochrome c biogenesis protein CcsA [Aquincola sp. MAHUQ-54]|uniref:Cytochrome c biogenesis protein CcsA n=1 Tax=Aquincola agrisoli TaxID=3119538 RepID=A0AAW9QFY2_9BURK